MALFSGGLGEQGFGATLKRLSSKNTKVAG
jgi:hypothetical protein